MTGNLYFNGNNGQGIAFCDTQNRVRSAFSFPTMIFDNLVYVYTSPGLYQWFCHFPKNKSGTFALIEDIPTKWSWSNVTNTPTTLSGHGIADAYTKTEANAKFLYKTGTAADAKELRHYNGGMVTGVPKIYYDEDENSWAVTDGNQQTLMPAGGSSYAKMADIPDAYTRAASDARYAPTSTAVTVASHTSQLSQLSQSIDYTTNNTTLVSTITNLAPSKEEADGMFIGTNKVNVIGRQFTVFDPEYFGEGGNDVIYYDETSEFWRFFGISFSSLCLTDPENLEMAIQNNGNAWQIIDRNHPSGGYIASIGDIPTQSSIANTAKNAAEAVVAEVMEYGLTNLTGASVTLASGQIGNVTLSAEQTNLALSLDFSSNTNRSGDCMLIAFCGAETTLAVGPSQSVDILGSYDKLKAGTNLVAVTRMMMRGTDSVVMVNVKEVK